MDSQEPEFDTLALGLGIGLNTQGRIWYLMDGRPLGLRVPYTKIPPNSRLYQLTIVIKN